MEGGGDFLFVREAQTQAAISTWTLPLGGELSHLQKLSASQHLPSLEVSDLQHEELRLASEGLPGAREKAEAHDGSL